MVYICQENIRSFSFNRVFSGNFFLEPISENGSFLQVQAITLDDINIVNERWEQSKNKRSFKLPERLSQPLISF
jgi:hypothetical protein